MNVNEQRTTFRLRISVAVETMGNGGYTTGQFRVEETATITADSFMEVASYIGKFHDLTESMREVES